MVLPASADRAIFEAIKGVAAPRLFTICAWCPNVRERTLAAKAEGAQVTHVICPRCKARLAGELSEVA